MHETYLSMKINISDYDLKNRLKLIVEHSPYQIHFIDDERYSVGVTLIKLTGGMYLPRMKMAEVLDFAITLYYMLKKEV